MILGKNKKKMYSPANPISLYKVGFFRVFNTWTCQLNGLFIYLFHFILQSVIKIEVIKWVITFLIGVCTGLVAFFIDTIVKLLSRSKFHLVDECILIVDCHKKPSEPIVVGKPLNGFIGKHCRPSPDAA